MPSLLLVGKKGKGKKRNERGKRGENPRRFFIFGVLLFFQMKKQKTAKSPVRERFVIKPGILTGF